MIRLPYLHKHRATSLKTCIEKSAIESGFSAAEVVHVMTHFLTALADEVSKGRAVAIPGFGMFVQKRYPRRAHRRYFRPVFLPAKAFKQQAQLGTPPVEVESRAALEYQRNNSRVGDKGERPFAILEKFREFVAQQVGR